MYELKALPGVKQSLCLQLLGVMEETGYLMY